MMLTLLETSLRYRLLCRAMAKQPVEYFSCCRSFLAISLYKSGTVHFVRLFYTMALCLAPPVIKSVLPFLTAFPSHYFVARVSMLTFSFSALCRQSPAVYNGLFLYLFWQVMSMVHCNEEECRKCADTQSSPMFLREYVFLNMLLWTHISLCLFTLSQGILFGKLSMLESAPT